jgi:argininosuccinate lyase
MLSHIEIKQDILDDPKYTYLFTVEAVNEKVNRGVPFREAYRQVGNDIENGTFHFDSSKGLHHTHEGSIGNLNNAEIEQLFQKAMLRFS